MIGYAAFFVFPLAMAYAAASDLFSYTISNKVSIGLVAGFAVAGLAMGLSPSQLGMHVLTGFAMLVVGFGMFSLGWIGGGDAKLAAATALWLGHTHVMAYLVYAGFFGGALSVFVLLLRSQPLPIAMIKIGWVNRLSDKDNGVPYGIALAASALLVYADTTWMKLLVD